MGLESDADLHWIRREVIDKWKAIVESRIVKSAEILSEDND
jgi:hypothetical protein